VSIGEFHVPIGSANGVPTQFLDQALNSFHDDSHSIRLFALIAAQQSKAKSSGHSASFEALITSYAPHVGSIVGSDSAETWLRSIALEFAQRPFQQKLLPSLQDGVLKLLNDIGLGHAPSDAFGLMAHLSHASAASSSGTENRAAARRRAFENLFGGATAHKLPADLRQLVTKTPAPNGRDMMRMLFSEAAQPHAAKARARTDEQVQLLYAHTASANDAFAMFHQHWRNASNPAPPTDPEKQVARRKFFGIRALPSLAKFLRLTVDITVPLSDLKDCDWVAAMFVADNNDGVYGSPNQTPDKTAFETDDVRKDSDAVSGSCGTSGAYTCFRPASWQNHRLGCSTVTDLNAAIAIRKGVVDLSATISSSSSPAPRFMISVLDMPAAISSLRVKTEQQSGAQRDGTLLDSVPTKVSERQSRGLQLFDNGAADHLNAHTMKSVTPGVTRPYFAEDLTIGYRPYIRRYRHGVNGNPDKFWRSLVARKIFIREIAGYVSNKAYRDVQARDHGYIQSAAKMQDNGDGTQSPTTDGQMFAWMGASLALSADTSNTTEAPGPGPGQDSDSDLQLNIEYRFSNSCEDLQPALRIGDGYLMGLSPVYPNCGGPTIAETSSAMADATVTLGASPGVPFKFGPPRDIPAPTILISETEAKDWQKTEGKSPVSRNGAGVSRGTAENVARIVLRSATNPAKVKDNVRRYLVPPRATFDVAEQSGMFDNVFADKPDGAFADYAQDPVHGGFLSADPPKKPDKLPPPDQRSRSAVLRPSAYAQPKAPYYPDPLARNLMVAFERGGATPEGFPDAVPLHGFWKQGASLITAKPIELLIKRWQGGHEGGNVDFKDTTGSVVGGARTVDRLAIEIAPAEEVNLQLWCVADRHKILCHHASVARNIEAAIPALIGQIPTQQPGKPGNDSLSQAIGHLANGVTAQELSDLFPDVDIAAVDTAVETAIAALTTQTPENGINSWLSLKVIHAVEQPLAIPAVPCHPSSKDANKLAIHPVRLQQKESWENYVKSLPRQPKATNLSTAFNMPSEENGTTTYFVGHLDCDRASTGEIRIEASWPETDPASAIQTVNPPKGNPHAPKTYKLCPPRKDRLLFSFKVPRNRGLNPKGKLDLTFDETGALRRLNYPFSDTTAREISLRIVATSRFTSDFPADPPPSGSPDPYALGRFEVESRPPIGSPRLCKAPQDSYQIYNVMVKATAAPPMPVVSRLEWIMPEVLTEFDPGRRVCVEKNFYPRLYLGQDWCRVDELVAVICAPKDLVSDRPYSEDLKPPPVLDPVPLSATEFFRAPAQREISASQFTDQTGAYCAIAESVSRWGSDPTARSGALTGIITRDRFSGFVSSKPDVTLPQAAGNTKNGSAQPADAPGGGTQTDDPKVSLLLYKPMFDPNCGEFYVDIGIDPGPAHAPIVELVIARYQPNVIDPKFQLSAVTRVQPFQIAPKRKVEVVIREDRNVTAIVRGVGYTDRLPEIPSVLDKAQTQLPAQYASKMKYPLQNVRIISLNDNNSTTGIQIHNESGRPLSALRVEPQFYHPELIWISEFKLPVSRSNYRYGLQIEEIDLHFSDDAYDGNEINDSQIVERLSTFSLTIDLQSGLYLPNGDQTAIQARG
jgi:hypothetical protein